MNKGFLNNMSASKSASSVRVDVEQQSIESDGNPVAISLGESVSKVNMGTRGSVVIHPGSVDPPLVNNVDNVAGHAVFDLGSQSQRDDNMERLPNQGMPVSLGNVVNDLHGADNVIIDNDKVVLDVEQLNVIHDSKLSSKGSKQPNVEQLIANANKNFDDAMNKIQCEIGASEANPTRSPLSSAISDRKSVV